MRAFADTNWLEALYFKPDPQDRKATGRDAIVQRRMRKQSEPLLISYIVLLESRNVFGRVAGTPDPQEWEDLQSDFNGRIYVDPMNWDALRRETTRLFERFSHRATIGTFDATLLASAQLAGAREFLSFDEHAKAVATAVGLKVFPELAADGKALLRKLRGAN